MNKKTRIILMEIALILILLLFSLIIEIRTIVFKRDCYKKFDINSSCPCIQTKKSEFKGLNISIDNLDKLK